MPTTLSRNLLYRAALPFLAPSPRGQMRHQATGQPLNDPQGYERLLCRHHVLGASLLLSDDGLTARVDTSVREPQHHAEEDTLYRVASITKMVTALAVLRLAGQGAFALDDAVAAFLPDGTAEPALEGITFRHLLTHTSGLCDISAADRALAEGRTWHEVLREEGVRVGTPGGQFRYCNLAFGLLGCVIEQVTGESVSQAVDRLAFSPLGMLATLDASGLDEHTVMPITRVLRYHPGHDMTITPLGRIPLTETDPTRHFGHTAGAMYTDAPSLSRLLSMIGSDGQGLVPPALMREMRSEQATYGKLSPGMAYGLGLVILRDPHLPGCRVLGHQGYAYGCADGAFFDEKTGRQVIFLNGGCSEARSGRLGLCNRDVLRWALGKEIPSWHRSSL